MAPVYFQLGETLGLDRLRNLAQPLCAAGALGPAGAAPAAGRSVPVPAQHHQAKLLASGGTVDDWAKKQGDALERTRTFLGTLDASGELSVAKLMLASSQIQNLG